MAAFCILTGQTPDVYHGLTLLERQAFIKAAAKARRQSPAF